MGREQARQRKHVYLLLAFTFCVLLIVGCSLIEKSKKGFQPKVDFREGELALSRDDYTGALKFYKRILERSPRSADEALFQIGVIYASPKYNDRDYQKALDSFLKLVKEFPRSSHRGEAERTIPLLRELINREKRIKAFKKHIEILELQIEQMKAIDLDIEEKRRKILGDK
jgi:outer membrane protein assembly factor BamD (BamD/ComL family)